MENKWQKNWDEKIKGKKTTPENIGSAVEILKQTLNERNKKKRKDRNKGERVKK